jgi:urease accessory protein
LLKTEKNKMTNDWLLWQLADSAFPSGGFAHSGGLEAAVQLGVVSDSDSLKKFLESALRQVDRGVARFAKATWENSEAFRAIDCDCDFFLNNHVANRASRAQGQALLASASKAFADVSASVAISSIALAVRRDRLSAHLAPVFGLVARALDIPAAQAENLFLFIHLRGYISAAVRLGIVGPMQAQQIQSSMVMIPANDLAHQTATQINPLLDLVQMTQDRLYSRLFQS